MSERLAEIRALHEAGEYTCRCCRDKGDAVGELLILIDALRDGLVHTLECDGSDEEFRGYMDNEPCPKCAGIRTKLQAEQE